MLLPTFGRPTIPILRVLRGLKMDRVRRLVILFQQKEPSGLDDIMAQAVPAEGVCLAGANISCVY